MAGLTSFIGQSIGIVAGYFALGWLLERGMTNINAYEWFYRANIPLWILAIAFTWWLSKSIDTSSESDVEN